VNLRRTASRRSEEDRRPKRRSLKRTAVGITAGIAVLGSAGIATGAIELDNPEHLVAFGPISETNGFPVWYKDSKNVKLEFCTDHQNPYCGILPEDVPDSSQPLSFPDNWPGEMFYQLIGSDVAIGGGDLTFTAGLEATFSLEEPRDGDQIVFSRVRFDADDLLPNTKYTITHPYGVDTLVTEADGSGRYVEDIGVAPGQFGGAMNGRVAPFLKWDPAVAPAAPAGYLGDPDVEHRVTGSPHNTNFLRVCATTPTGTQTCAENNLFSVTGKVATNGGVEPIRATVTRESEGDATLDVFAESDLDPQSIEITGTGFDPTRLRGENGKYLAHLDLAGATPTSVRLTNVGDTPVSTKTIAVTDAVEGEAIYDADNHRLTIEAASTDDVSDHKLTADGYGDLTDGLLVVEPIDAAPSTVKVTSAGGGVVNIPVRVSGGGFPAIPVVAFAGVNQVALQQTLVTLDASGSTGPITGYSWQQVDDGTTRVQLTGADTKTPTFTTPTLPDGVAREDLVFRLTVNGAGGPSTSDVQVRVTRNSNGATAVAGANQRVDQATPVTLDGSGSTGRVQGYQWVQVDNGAPRVLLTGANTAKPTFVAPKTDARLVFDLTVTGPVGTSPSTDRTVVNVNPDRVGLTRNQFTRSGNEWRVEGTSSTAGPGVKMTIRMGSSVNASGVPNGAIIGTADVDTLGAWRFRLAATPTNLRPAAGATISIVSSGGGMLIGQPVTIR
jgi:hypothetical protein